jgi:hypothetical protein
MDVLLPLLDHKDWQMRRAATYMAAVAAKADSSLVYSCHDLLYASAAPQEEELIKKVRKLVMKWLEEHKK